MHADLPSSQFSGQFRIGRVSAVKAAEHRVEVKFEEQDGFVSWDMPMLVNRGGDYWLPARDNVVVCLIIEGRLGVGFVLGVIYTDSDAAPLSDAGQRSIASDDLRLGAADASKKVAVAPECMNNFNALWAVLNTVFGNESTPIVTPSPTSPDPVYAAVKAAIAVLTAANNLPPHEVAAETVSAK